jgi:hypothetical protein
MPERASSRYEPPSRTAITTLTSGSYAGTREAYAAGRNATRHLRTRLPVLDEPAALFERAILRCLGLLEQFAIKLFVRRDCSFPAQVAFRERARVSSKFEPKRLVLDYFQQPLGDLVVAVRE